MEEKNSEKKERKMRDSGIPWIGEVPEGWKIKKIKYLIKQTKDGIKIGPFGSALSNKTLDNGDYNVYGQANLVNSDFTTTKNTINQNTFNNLSSYEVIPGDICVSMMGTIGKCKVVPHNIHRGIMDSHLIKIRLNDNEMISEFFEYVYDKDNSPVCFTQMQYEKTGSIMDGLNTSIVKRIYLPTPPISEQHRIAAFLDSKCSEIDTLIENIRARMESVKEYKKAVITEAVTKGLNKDAKMKDSGVEWIGKIPEGWKVVKLKQYIKNVSSGLSAVTSDSSEDSGKYILRTSAVSSEKFIESEVKSVTKQAESRLICPVEADTVIMSRMNTSAMVGACAYVARNYENLFVPDKLWKIKFTLELSAKYAWYLINSAPIRGWFSSTSTGASASMQNISLTDFYNAYAPIPRVIEQRQISDYLDSKCAEIDALLQNYEDQLATLEEYKKSLIYEYVTGKKEVPAA